MRNFKISENSITIKRTDSLKKYLREIKKYKLLSPDEEYEIAVLAHQGDEKARQKLINHNLRFVVSVAKQYETKKLDLEDLINEGNVGLIKAVHRFDPSRGFKFISYAIWWIRQSIVTYSQENGKTIRLPANKIGSTNKLRQGVNFLEQKLERKPAYDEIVKEFSGNFSMEAIDFFVNENSTFTKSLDEQVGNDIDSDSLINLIPNNESIDPSSFIDLEESTNRKDLLLSELSIRDRLIIELTLGLSGDEPKTSKEVGKIIGISTTRVNFLKKKLLKVLKYKLLNKANWMIT